MTFNEYQEQALSTAMCGSLCDISCRGFYQDPMPGDLWPGETEEDFGYPCSSNATREMNCSHPSCDGIPRSSCDHCDEHFCLDHGTQGGDKQVQDVGAVAYPSQCWKCGGFNVDA